ncbi:hypothetical protein A2U01_0083282, partial [Trifolium medium]|nr:hypothetical protein [Trifolium medium]
AAEIRTTTYISVTYAWRSQQQTINFPLLCIAPGARGVAPSAGGCPKLVSASN